MRSATEVSTSLFFLRIVSVANRLLRYLLIGANLALVVLNGWTIGKQLSILIKYHEWPGGTLNDMFNLSFYELAQWLPERIVEIVEFVFYEVHILLISVVLFGLFWMIILVLNLNYRHLAHACRRLENELADIRIYFRLGHQ
jgi:hypothetical protein